MWYQGKAFIGEGKLYQGLEGGTMQGKGFTGEGKWHQGLECGTRGRGSPVRGSGTRG